MFCRNTILMENKLELYFIYPLKTDHYSLKHQLAYCLINISSYLFIITLHTLHICSPELVIHMNMLDTHISRTNANALFYPKKQPLENS